MRPSEVELTGRLLAGQAHELRNILASLKESAGLAGDLLRLAGGSDARLVRSLEAIERQVARGEAMARGLSRFAHSMDGPEAPLAIGDLAALAAALAARRARSRRVGIEVGEGGEGADRLAGPHPFRLLLLACALVGEAAERAPEGGTVVLTPAVREGRAALRIAPAAAGEAGRTAAELGCGILAEDDALLLVLPR